MDHGNRGKRKVVKAFRGNSIPKVSANQVINCPDCGGFMKRVEVLEHWRLACTKCAFITDRDLKRSVIRRSGRNRPTKMNIDNGEFHVTFLEFEAWSLIMQEHTIIEVAGNLSMSHAAIHHAVNKVQGFFEGEIDVEMLRKPLYALCFCALDVIREAIQKGRKHNVALDILKGLGVLKGDVPPVALAQMSGSDFNKVIDQFKAKREGVPKTVDPIPPNVLEDNDVTN